MKYIGITMRVDNHESIQERRDSIDQRWYEFLKNFNLIPILLPNSECSLKILFDLNFAGILFTGGNSLNALGGNAPERDFFENKLLESLIKRKIPLVGICRGMQVIQNFYGVKLRKVEGHVKSRHFINNFGLKREVNSYHEYGACDSVSELKINCVSDDGVVESVSHVSLPIHGIMWHPEREKGFSQFDIDFFKRSFSL